MRLLDSRQVAHAIAPATEANVISPAENAKAVSTLCEHCSLEIQDLHFGTLRMAFEIWTKLEDIFGPRNQRLGMVASNQLSRQR